MSTPTWGIPATCSGEGGSGRCGAVGLVPGAAGLDRRWAGAGMSVGTAAEHPASPRRHHSSACAYTTSMRAPVFSAWIS